MLLATQVYKIGDVVIPTTLFRQEFVRALDVRGRVVGFSKDKRCAMVLRRGQKKPMAFAPVFFKPLRTKCPKHKTEQCYVCDLFKWSDYFDGAAIPVRGAAEEQAK